MKKLFFTLALLISVEALAGKKSPNKNDEEASSDDSSAELRKGKSGYIVGEPAGASVGSIPSVGVRGAGYLTPDSLIEMGAASGTLEYLFFTFKSTFIHVDYKVFFGNSFYARFGAAYRNIGAKVGSDEVLSVSSYGPDLAIGNQWQWESFTLGCDWLGSFFPVTVTKNSFSDSSLNEADKKSLKDSGEKLGKTTSPQSLRFYLGMSF